MSLPQDEAPFTNGVPSHDEIPKDRLVSIPPASSVSTTSQRVKTFSPLLKLPAEIRVKIYNYAIDCNEIVLQISGRSGYFAQTPTLLLLDHQTRSEVIVELQKRTLVLQKQEDNSPILHLGLVLTYNMMLQLSQVVLTFDHDDKTSRMRPYKELLRTTSLPESQLKYFDICIKQPRRIVGWRICGGAKDLLAWLIEPTCDSIQQPQNEWAPKNWQDGKLRYAVGVIWMGFLFELASGKRNVPGGRGMGRVRHGKKAGMDFWKISLR